MAAVEAVKLEVSADGQTGRVVPAKPALVVNSINSQAIQSGHSVVIEGLDKRTKRDHAFPAFQVSIRDIMMSKPDETILDLVNVPAGVNVYSLESYKLHEIDTDWKLEPVKGNIVLKAGLTDQGIVLVTHSGKAITIEIKNPRYAHKSGFCDVLVKGTVDHVKNNGIPRALHLELK